MSLRDELNAAIASHGIWNKALKLAIRTGKLDTPIEAIKSDRECDFGKWLYRASIIEEHRHSPHYQEILKLHAIFHEKAAIVGKLAISGNEHETEKMLCFNGAFTAASSNLIKAILDWLRAT